MKNNKEIYQQKQVLVQLCTCNFYDQQSETVFVSEVRFLQRRKFNLSLFPLNLYLSSDCL